MTSDDRMEEPSRLAATCEVCRHVEDDHVERDVELGGVTVQRFYCERCDDEHEFIVADEEADPGER